MSEDLRDRLEPGSIKREGDGAELDYQPIAAFRCVYCGRTAVVARFSDGSEGVLHDTPECAEFIAMDPLTYVRENRKRFQQDIAEGRVPKGGN